MKTEKKSVKFPKCKTGPSTEIEMKWLLINVIVQQFADEATRRIVERNEFIARVDDPDHSNQLKYVDAEGNLHFWTENDSSFAKQKDRLARWFKAIQKR